MSSKKLLRQLSLVRNGACRPSSLHCIYPALPFLLLGLFVPFLLWCGAECSPLGYASGADVPSSLRDTALSSNPSPFLHVSLRRRGRALRSSSLVPERDYLEEKFRERKVLRPGWLATHVVEVSRAYQQDPLLVAAVIQIESDFREEAVSHKGARGLMQLMPATAREFAAKENFQWLGANQLHNPDYNVWLGVSYLDYLHQSFAEKPGLALMAYNWGPGNLQRALGKGDGIPRSVRRYASKILSLRKRWTEELNSYYLQSP